MASSSPPLSGLPEALHKTRYLWLKNPENLSHKQMGQLMLIFDTATIELLHFQ